MQAQATKQKLCILVIFRAKFSYICIYMKGKIHANN